ncbi:MAG TPA: glycosyltransferase family 2 protein [Acidimicrobiales bacterium]|nr:glycosyltransferase family 2 protein [Acidimicrobiales bacterium]
MNVSAVVVNYNAGDHLRDCVRSLRADGVGDVVVADNASRDRSLDGLDSDVVVVHTGANLGFGTGANRGAARAAATSDALLICNPDLVVEPGSVKSLAAALERDPGLGLVAPRIENTDGTTYPSPRIFPGLFDAVGHAFVGFFKPDNRFTRRYRMLGVDRSQASASVDWVSGSCFLVRRSAWEQLGGFDESYFMYAEDVDLCWRAHRAGWRVGFEPEARVVHVQGVSANQHPYRMILEHHRSLLRFAVRTTKGTERVLLPVVALGLGVRVAVAWAQRALLTRRAR